MICQFVQCLFDEVSFLVYPPKSPATFFGLAQDFTREKCNEEKGSKFVDAHTAMIYDTIYFRSKNTASRLVCY